MGWFVNKVTGVTFSVADSKDERYAAEGFEPAADGASNKKAPAKKAASSKSEK
jgi:hypothetical protein